MISEFLAATVEWLEARLEPLGCVWVATGLVIMPDFYWLLAYLGVGLVTAVLLIILVIISDSMSRRWYRRMTPIDAPQEHEVFEDRAEIENRIPEDWDP